VEVVVDELDDTVVAVVVAVVVATEDVMDAALLEVDEGLEPPS
jgi:hypothetical protein